MALLSLIDVARTYDARRPLIRGVSLVVREGDRIGLIGPNGAGKSTLLALLAGRETPDAGERTVRRDLRIGWLEQEPALPAEERVRAVVRAGIAGHGASLAELERVHEALAGEGLSNDDTQRLLRRQERLERELEELGGHAVEHRVEGTLDGLGLRDPEARCGTLSGGEARRVALARLLVSRPDLLLLDEPTNHLDAFVVTWLEATLARLDLPFVLVTHDRYLLDRTVNRIVELDRGRLFEYEGGYGAYLEARAARLESEAKAERARLNLLRRETAWMRRAPQARATRAKSRVARYEALVEGAPERGAGELELAFPTPPRLGAKVVRLRGVHHAYGERRVLPELDLELTADMRLGVVGPNGAGKSTLLEILLGRLEPTGGEVVVGETVRFATVDQRRSDLNPERTVVEEVAGEARHVQVGERLVHVAGFLDAFLFPGPMKDVTIGSLSGGERGRVLLAKLLLAGGNVLVLDEPTNDLDLGTLRALEEALVAFPGAVVVVSHDRWFLDRVATHVLHLDGEGGATLHTGDASTLLERWAQEREAQREPVRRAPRADPAKARAPASAPKRLTPWEERELEELTERVEALESALEDVDARLADPALYRGATDGGKALREERARAEAELEAAMARWEELAERAGA